MTEKLQKTREISCIYEEDIRKDFYTKTKIYWGKRKVVKLNNGQYYHYHTTLVVNENVIEVNDFDEGLGVVCDFCIPNCIPSDQDFNKRVNSLLLDVLCSLEPYKEETMSVLFGKKYKKHEKKKFFKKLDEITSKLMDIYNMHADL